MAAHKYETTFPSQLYALKPILNDALNFIKTHAPSLCTEEMMDLRLVFMELLCNAIIHGNGQDIQKSVRVCVEIANGTLHTWITDEGPGFDHGTLLKTIEDSNLDSENGRGMQLVHKLTDRLSFNAKGNEIHFYKRVTSNEQGFSD